MARKKAQQTAFDAADFVKSNPYIQRLAQDAKLRDNVRTAVDSARNVSRRLANGKAPHKALMNDKRLQKDLQMAITAARDAAGALSEGPKRRARRGLTLGRAIAMAGVGGALALVGSEKLRSKVLDTLFGAEEEFEYTPPATTTPPAPTEPSETPPVSAA
jgi:hypothetical protein